MSGVPEPQAGLPGGHTRFVRDNEFKSDYTIIVGGKTGAFSGFMMQRGRMIVLGDAGKNLGDSMYDGTIYVGGAIESLGVDAVPGEMTDLEAAWLERKLKMYDLQAPNGVPNLKKIVAGKRLWNYDNLEPTEKKIVL